MNGNMANMQNGFYKPGYIPPAIKPSGIWYLVAAVCFIAGIVIAGILLGSAAMSMVEALASMQDFEGPGQIEAHFQKPGEYYIYTRNHASIQRNLAQTLKFTVNVHGVETPLPLIPVAKNQITTNMHFDGENLNPMYSFMLNQPATITVKAIAIQDKGLVGQFAVGPAIDEKYIMHMAIKAMSGIGAGLGGFILALLIFIITIIRRAHCKKRLADIAYAAQLQQPQYQYVPPAQTQPQEPQQPPYPPNPPVE